MQPVPEQQSWNPQSAWSSQILLQFTSFTELAELVGKRQNSQIKFKLSKIDWTPGKESSCSPEPTPIDKLIMASMVWNISIAQLWLAAWLRSLPAPAHLLISQTWETEKKYLISQQQLKTSVYYQHSSCTRSKTQQALGRKLTPPQLKPRQKNTLFICYLLLFYILFQ